MTGTKKQIKPLLLLGLFIIIIIGMFFLYQNFKPKTTQGAKKVIVEIVIPNEKNKEFTLQTDEEYLRKPLEDAKIIKGTESEFGLFIKEVNGLQADDSKQEWWCVTKNNEPVNTGVDTTPINDGDHFELTLKTGY